MNVFETPGRIIVDYARDIDSFINHTQSLNTEQGRASYSVRGSRDFLC
jgi:hypothetical protein